MSDEPWIRTYTGKKFHFLDPQSDEIDITDIAHSLSMQCRFTGHTRFHYSVAQHSVLVAWWLERAGFDDRTQFAGLMHDAAEAYIADLSRPIKGLPGLVGYREIEQQIAAAINRKFDCFQPESESLAISQADRALCEIEGKALVAEWEGKEVETHGIDMRSPWKYRDTRSRFLWAFMKLGGKP